MRRDECRRRLRPGGLRIGATIGLGSGAPGRMDAGEPIEEAGYQVIWHGMPRRHEVAILSRRAESIELRRGIPGDDADSQARYLEADVGGLRVASVYLPNGNPVGSENWEYRLRWFARFNAYAKTLLARGVGSLRSDDTDRKLNHFPDGEALSLARSDSRMKAIATLLNSGALAACTKWLGDGTTT